MIQEDLFVPKPVKRYRDYITIEKIEHMLRGAEMPILDTGIPNLYIFLNKWLVY